MQQKILCCWWDDPVTYKNAEDQTLLEETLALPKQLEVKLRTVQTHIETAWAAFQARMRAGDFNQPREIERLIEVFTYQRQWYEEQLSLFGPQNHTEHFFADLKFRRGRDRVQYTIDEILAMQNMGEKVHKDTLIRFYRKALATFDVTMTAFQRKRYENLSHEPNKAMNLNSYLGLIGKSWSEVVSGGKLFLEEAAKETGAQLVVPAADYVITLDADSVLSATYARRLIYEMERPENSRIAVAQTPYNTFRCPFIDLERVAGATTDIQHYVHQGFEYFHAIFWVGANALLRVRALGDIKEEDEERGYKIARYIQDRTVIEDTESSIDLVVKGWDVFNYHDQLAFSATPPDFGSLIIQRRRWANGGLIIFPKLFSYLFTGSTKLKRRLVECFIRTHYLLSTAFVSIGVLAMILYPFAGELHIGPLVSVSILYFYLYARDLIILGYRFTDLFRVYALNLLLIPVNVAGTLKSIQQARIKVEDTLWSYS